MEGKNDRCLYPKEGNFLAAKQWFSRGKEKGDRKHQPANAARIALWSWGQGAKNRGWKMSENHRQKNLKKKNIQSRGE